MSGRSMPSSFDDDRDQQETGSQKIWRKLKEEPLVPLGTALTIAAFYNAWRASRRGDHKQVQRMFRARVGAQAFTVCAIVAGGMYYGADREKRKELIKLEAQQRAEERHNKWLRELEVRDEEEKALQDALRKKRDRKAAAAADKKDAPSSGTAAAAAAAGGQDESQKEGGSGGGVLGALSSAGGWFGTGKKEDKSSSEAVVEEKKPAEEKK